MNRNYRKRNKTFFGESLLKNQQSYNWYLTRFVELSIASIKWNGVPDTVDTRYIEYELFNSGAAVYFDDEVIGNLCLSCIQSGNFNVYGYPTSFRAYSRYNNYQNDLTLDNAVIIYNNMSRTNGYDVLANYAERLAALDRIIDINANAQKTPTLVVGSEKQRMTLLNLYKEWDGNAPVIFGDKGLDLNSLTTLTTGAPYVADRLYELKTRLWNEALTVMGISNVSYQKRERMVSDEVTRSLGGAFASRKSRMLARETAVEKINKMFGLDISVEFNEIDAPELAESGGQGGGTDE